MPDRRVEVLYELFQTRDEMNAAFQVNANNKAAPEGECAIDRLATSPYSIGGEERRPGPLLHGGAGALHARNCRAQSHIEWTDENASIYAHAIRNDLGDLSLYQWWLTASGPVLPREDAVPAKDPSSDVAGARLQDGAYLLAPIGGCAGFTDETCALHIEGTTYRIRFTRSEPPGTTFRDGHPAPSEAELHPVLATDRLLLHESARRLGEQRDPGRPRTGGPGRRTP